MEVERKINPIQENKVAGVYTTEAMIQKINGMNAENARLLDSALNQVGISREVALNVVGTLDVSEAQQLSVLIGDLRMETTKDGTDSALKALTEFFTNH